MTVKRLVSAGTIGALMLMQGAALQAKTPSDVTDLIGVRAGSGETMLRQRGYDYMSGRTGSSTKWSYWWHKGGNRCISVATVDGRYQSIDKVSERDCGKSGGGSSGAAVAIGAAAIIGALAIASSNKHKDRDDNWNGSQYPGSSSVTPYELRYIVDMNTGRADNELRNNKYKFQTAGTGYYNRWSYWWNKRDNACVGVTSSGGRVDSIVSAAASACGKSGYGSSGGGYYGNDSYSPSRGVTCYPSQRACYEAGAGYSAYWSSREFRY